MLLAMFADSDAYLIGIYRHPKHANWAAEEIFAVIVRNWPTAGLVHESLFRHWPHAALQRRGSSRVAQRGEQHRLRVRWQGLQPWRLRANGCGHPDDGDYRRQCADAGATNAARSTTSTSDYAGWRVCRATPHRVHALRCHVPASRSTLWLSDRLHVLLRGPGLPTMILSTIS